jgi:tape measure domain-containing protein
MATEVATLLFEADARPLRSANNELSKTERAGVRAENAAKKMGTELKKAANDSINPIQKVNSGISSLASALTALASALVVRQFIAYTDQWTDLNSRLVNATGSAEAANAALIAISETARTTYSSLQQTAQAFLANAMALNELGYTTRQQVQLADAMNNALVISGTKGQQAASVMDALSRAMALGQLSGQNFNTVIQSGGRLVQALADGLGVTTRELRGMATEGLLTTSVIIEALNSEMPILRQEAEAMSATIGDAFVQLGNLSLELVGKLDEAAGLSSSIANFIVGAVNNFRRIHMPTETQRLMKLQDRSHELLADLSKMSARELARNSSRMRQELAKIDIEMNAIFARFADQDAAEAVAAAAGASERAQAEAQRLADHQAELARIEAEKQARAAASRQATVDTQAQRIAESLLSQEDQIKLSYERQRDTILESTQITGDKRRELLLKLTQLEIDALDDLYQKNADREKALEIEKFARLVENNRKITELENNVRQERIKAAAQQTQQLLEFDNVLLRNKSQTSQAAFRMSVSLMNEEKRMAAGKIISDSYAAAMAAWKSLASIPFIGPALGAAAAGGIIAAGVSYSAKSLAGRALGGQVRAGQSYVVGERGPEVLTMGSTNGKVIPNSAINRAPATGKINRTANVSFNITANDATGFDQLLNASRGKIIDIVNSALNDNGREALL